MKKKFIPHSRYLDREWFTQLKDLNSTYQVDNEVDAVEIFFTAKQQLIFKYAGNAKRNNEKLFNTGKVRFKHLKVQVLNREKNPFIRKYYVDKINESLYKLEANHIKNLPIKNSNESNLKLFEIHQKLYPLPPQKMIDLFINEFISFVAYANKAKLLPSAELKQFSTLKTQTFYKIKKNALTLDFGVSVKAHKSFEKKYEKDIEEREFKHHKIQRIFVKFLNELEIEKYKVAIKSKNVFSANALKKTITIPENANLNYKRLVEIIFHEICVHVLRSHLGSLNINEKEKQLKLLTVGRSQNLYVEEGIASYFEQNAFFESNKHDIISLMDFYIRLISVHLALNFEPFEVYEKLDLLTKFYAAMHKKDEEFANKKREILVKRLYRDYKVPQKGVANTKIAQYLYGNRMIWEFLENGGKIQNLFAGKISFEDLEQIRRLGMQIPDEILGQKDFPRQYIHDLIQKCI
jgi:hypothetical protein